MSARRWSGRFQKATDPLALDFTQSVSFDKKLYYYDILGSLAHLKALSQARIISEKEREKMTRALKKIAQEIGTGKVELSEELEDVHRNIEALLTKKVGRLGGKLHTARSRNDQVALDLRLYCRDRLLELAHSLLHLEKTFLKKAKEDLDLILPGYTHLQRAQPILFSHWCLAYIEMFERDRGRLCDAFKRLNILPLGSGALAGVTFAINRHLEAHELGFADVSHNSLDAVSDRDFAIEIAAAGALLMMHLSRLSEELILWSTTEFDFIRLPESFCTGSSMMPQKMNPDIPELIRGKTGRVYGTLLSLLTTMKGLPLAYNRDMQESQEPLFDLFETTINCVDILSELIHRLKPNREKMLHAASDGFLLATDLADWLVKEGVEFRSAHEMVARLSRYASNQKKGLSDLTLKEMRRFSPRFNPRALPALNLKRAIASRQTIGGTARENVIQEIRRLERQFK